MSDKVLRITLSDDDSLIADKELGKVLINSDSGTVDYIDADGNAESVIMFASSTTSSAYMEVQTYDTNINGVVDDSERLGGILASDYGTKTWISANTGNMNTSKYDISGTGIVDNSERLGNQLPSYYASKAYVDTVAGDMKKSVYDINNNGVVDNSEMLEGKSGSFYSNYLNLSNRPKLEGLEDTLFSTKVAGDIVVYNGANWINTGILDLGIF